MPVIISLSVRDSSGATASASVSALQSAGALDWPGKPGGNNPVGFANTPANILFNGVQYSNTAYPGSLTVSTPAVVSGASAANPTVIAFHDIVGSGFAISQQNVTFIGCRFQGSAPSTANVVLGNSASNVAFLYCTVQPLVSAVGTTPPNPGSGPLWPCSGTGTTGLDPSPNQISDNQSYIGMQLWNPNGSGNQPSGEIFIDHCDMWGAGSSVAFNSGCTGYKISITENWLHDCCAGTSPTLPHTNGICCTNNEGFQGASLGSVNIHHNVIASIANTEGIGFQDFGATPYKNITVDSNYITGFGYAVRFYTSGQSGNGGMSNLAFTNNVFSTAVRWQYAWVYNDESPIFTAPSTSGNVWSGNTLSIWPGTTPNPSASPTWTSGQNGFFIWPDTSINLTDYP
jgi:hypothetical protein